MLLCSAEYPLGTTLTICHLLDLGHLAGLRRADRDAPRLREHTHYGVPDVGIHVAKREARYLVQPLVCHLARSACKGTVPAPDTCLIHS